MVKSLTRKAKIKFFLFQPPVPHGKWEDDVLDATRPVKLCLQVDQLYKRIEGQEDCLQLHIYTPNVNDKI